MPTLRKVSSAEAATWQRQTRPTVISPPARPPASVPPPRAADDFHARGVARALGKGRDLDDVLLWMESGALEAYNRGKSTRPRWQIPRAALLRFLANEDYWMAWSVERITDADLRAEAARIRDGKPGWVTVEQAATLFEVRPTLIMAWIRQHGLPARRYRSLWYVRANAHEVWQRPAVSVRPRSASEQRPSTAPDLDLGGAAPFIALRASEREQLNAWSRQRVSAEEQAQRLGYPIHVLEPVWLELQRQGLIPRRKATRGPDWSPKHRAMLRKLVKQGLSYDEIAEAMGRTPAAIRIACKRYNLRLLRAPGVYTAREVAALMGLPCSKVVARWIAEGMLAGRNGGRTDRPLWRVQRDDLMAFMAEPLYWMAWRVDRVVDPYLRTYAEQLRDGQPEWHTPGHVARHYGAGRNTPQQWIERGFIPSQRWGNHWIHQSVLDHWAPPGQPGVYGAPLDGAIVQAAIEASRQHAQRILEQFRAGEVGEALAPDSIKQAAA